ncbi:sodium- and chloride-dependent GABA transporter 1-like isoform X1 [Saccostrea echinata]|uniref:sodium- and chloride-dependent GABA transporter 1-like isoform X1 n=2 Tax=Saccostrea echinata TaxID=191078 RepID=UPI002A83F7EB|nr:sodium- and chloride-dependent GABA transporter 1-like isoform X1 [Saccostrea echinata]
MKDLEFTLDIAKMKKEDAESSKSCSSDDSIVQQKKKIQERDGWKGRLDFIMTCIGYAVGLGNIWRFPYLCYKSGGGAFFIPYVMFLVLCGVPLFFLEASYGQFSSLSPISVWRMCPLFKGVGVGMVMVSAIVCIYYNVIVAWTLYFLYMSFRAVLPWSTCDNDWNTENCVVGIGNIHNPTRGNVSAFSLGNSTYNDTSNTNSTFFNGTVAATALVGKKMSASEEFWTRHVLEITEGINNPGTIRWQLLICLTLAWVTVFLCLFKGVKVLGKVMHFAAPFPYLVLLVLLIRGVTLPGAVNGIKFYILPKWERLADYQVWGDAALQIFYSVGMAWGGIITMASYNRFSNNIYRDAMLVPIINCSTSIFAGFVIFSILGFMAESANTTVENVVSQGPGLTFVAYPEAVANLPISPMWAVLFFLMLFTIGLDSQFGMVETCISAFLDEYPHLLRKKRTLICFLACLFEFLLGLPCITQGGIYVLQIMDWYCASFSLMLISLTECLAIAWIYGTERFYKDIELMLGYKPHAIWHIMWRYITPTIILGIWLFSVITLGPVTYDGRAYPEWAIVFGWCLGVASMLPIPIIAITSFICSEGTLCERWNKLTTPLESWGPSQPEDRERYHASLSHSKSGTFMEIIDSVQKAEEENASTPFIDKVKMSS